MITVFVFYCYLSFDINLVWIHLLSIHYETYSCKVNIYFVWCDLIFHIFEINLSSTCMHCDHLSLLRSYMDGLLISCISLWSFDKQNARWYVRIIENKLTIFSEINVIPNIKFKYLNCCNFYCWLTRICRWFINIYHKFLSFSRIEFFSSDYLLQTDWWSVWEGVVSLQFL